MKNKKDNLNEDFDFEIIKKDVLKTIILIALSFGVLFLIKYLQTDFSFNKFF